MSDLVAGTTMVFKFGTNSDMDSGAEDVWDGGGAYPFPAAAVTLQAVSATSGDRSASTAAGAKTLNVQGLGEDYKVQSETVTMAGTTAVTLANTYLRVFRAKVVTAGSGQTNAADIAVTTTSGTTMARITAGEGQTLMALYTIPADYRYSYMHGWWCAAGKSVANTIVFRLFERPEGGAWNLKERVEMNDSMPPYQHMYPKRRYIAPKTDVRVEGTAGANNMRGDAGFDIELVR